MGKPDPEVYLEAARRLGAPPAGLPRLRGFARGRRGRAARRDAGDRRHDGAQRRGAAGRRAPSRRSPTSRGSSGQRSPAGKHAGVLAGPLRRRARTAGSSARPRRRSTPGSTRAAPFAPSRRGAPRASPCRVRAAATTPASSPAGAIASGASTWAPTAIDEATAPRRGRRRATRRFEARDVFTLARDPWRLLRRRVGVHVLLRHRPRTARGVRASRSAPFSDRAARSWPASTHCAREPTGPPSRFLARRSSACSPRVPRRSAGAARPLGGAAPRARVAGVGAPPRARGRRHAVTPPAARGQVQTVLGPVSPEALGPTLMHEHLLCDIRHPSERKPDDLGPELALDTVLGDQLRHGEGRAQLRARRGGDGDRRDAPDGRRRRAEPGRAVLGRPEPGSDRPVRDLARLGRARGHGLRPLRARLPGSRQRPPNGGRPGRRDRRRRAGGRVGDRRPRRDHRRDRLPGSVDRAGAARDAGRAHRPGRHGRGRQRPYRPASRPAAGGGGFRAGPRRPDRTAS